MDKVTIMSYTTSTDESVGDAIAKVTSTMGLTDTQQLFLTYEENVNLEHEYGGDISKMGLWYYNEGTEFSGEDYLVIGGYEGVVSGLLSGLNIDIKLGHVVSEIDYSGVSGVAVKMADNSTLTSDFVVCTIPLGVLKSGLVKFTPSLPAAKIEAMTHLNMGLLNKLYLEFPTVFWGEYIEVINHVATTKGLW